MKKKALIVDLDGTLYYQKPVQIFMAAELIVYYILHFWRLKELKIIAHYRAKHNGTTSLDTKTFCIEQKTDIKTLNNLIQKWLIYKPLKWIKLFADRELIKYLNKKQKNIFVIVYSDYETHQKLNILNFKPDFEFFYDMVNICFPKPNPQGLNYIASQLNLQAKDILVIGDRQDKDGLAASDFGAEFLFLPQNPIKRHQIIKKLNI